MEGTLKMQAALLLRKEKLKVRKEKLKNAFNNGNVTKRYRYSESTVKAGDFCASRR